MGFFEKLKQGLSKTASSISSVFTASELDDEFYDDLEERLILADLGMQTTEEAMEKLRAQDDDDRKAFQSAARKRQEGPSVRGRYVPRGGGRSAGNLVEPRACGHHPPA